MFEHARHILRACGGSARQLCLPAPKDAEMTKSPKGKLDKPAVTIVGTQPPREGSKPAVILALLADSGASMEDLTRVTGWAAHSVRAGMTGLRKRGYDIGKRTEGSSSVWFIAAGEGA